MKHFISMADTDKKILEEIFERADAWKEKTRAPSGRTAALLFNMPSTRTLVSFEVALEQLGLASSHLDYVFTQMVRGEEIKDTAQALSQYVACIVARLNDHALMEKLALNATVPVINAGTPLEHPCQALADLYTLRKRKLLKSGTRIAIIGDPASNVAHSLIAGAALYGMKVMVIAPTGYEPRAEYRKGISLHHELDAMREVDAVYISSWMDGGDAERLRDFLPYQVNAELLQKSPHALVMHPLPAFRGIEVTSDVLDSKQCVSLEQSKNRLYVQKALVDRLVG